MQRFEPILSPHARPQARVRRFPVGLAWAVRAPLVVLLLWALYQTKCLLGIDLIPGVHLSDILGF